MSIQSEINRISEAVSAAYDSVENKGGTIPAQKTVSNLAGAIKTIEQVKASDVYTKAEIDNKLGQYLPLSGGTLTGNLTGEYITGTWLQTTAASNMGGTPPYIAVMDASGWMYYRTPSELFNDIGVQNAINTTVVRAMNSSY